MLAKSGGPSGCGHPGAAMPGAIGPTHLSSSARRASASASANGRLAVCSGLSSSQISSSRMSGRCDSVWPSFTATGPRTASWLRNLAPRSPCCTDEGGWYHDSRMSSQARLERSYGARSSSYCAYLDEARGGDDGGDSGKASAAAAAMARCGGFALRRWSRWSALKATATGAAAPEAGRHIARGASWNAPAPAASSSTPRPLAVPPSRRHISGLIFLATHKFGAPGPTFRRFASGR
eukprot:scaffold23434_cov135-Isochrysis_galbana.AAC.5